MEIPATICIEDITFQRRKPIPFSFEQTIRRALFKRGYKVSENKNSWQQKMGVIKTYSIYVNKSKLSPNNKLAKEQEPLLRNRTSSFKPLQTCKGIKKHIHKNLKKLTFTPSPQFFSWFSISKRLCHEHFVHGNNPTRRITLVIQEFLTVLIRYTRYSFNILKNSSTSSFQLPLIMSW